MAIKLLIADDDALIREGLKVIFQLDSAFEIAACVEDGRKAYEFCREHAPDVALLDVRMPELGGLEAAALITGETDTKVLILTTFDDDDLIVRAVKSGTSGYLLKNAPPERIKEAVKMVYGGGTVLQDSVLDRIRLKLSDAVPAGFDPGLFTERELEVVKAIARGMSNREVAAHLFLSEGTVKNYITTILDKTGLDHRTQIAIYYLTGKTPS